MRIDGTTRFHLHRPDGDLHAEWVADPAGHGGWLVVGSDTCPELARFSAEDLIRGASRDVPGAGRISAGLARSDWQSFGPSYEILLDLEGAHFEGSRHYPATVLKGAATWLIALGIAYALIGLFGFAASQVPEQRSEIMRWLVWPGVASVIVGGCVYRIRRLWIVFAALGAMLALLVVEMSLVQADLLPDGDRLSDEPWILPASASIGLAWAVYLGLGGRWRSSRRK